jgi:hypothetical protein
MLSRKTLGVAGAAILGSMALLATNTANAQINLDTDMGKVTFAKETVTLSRTVDGETYYVVSGIGDNVDIVGMAGFNLQENTLVDFTLTNMVFNTSLTETSLAAGAGNPTISRSSKGQSGDNTVRFLVQGGGDVEDTTDLTLNLVDIAVKDGARGSITMTVTDIALPTFFTNTATTSGAVSLSDALVVTTTPYNPIATIASDFKNFKVNARDGEAPDDTAKLGNVGAISIGVAMNEAGTAGTTRHAGTGALIADVADILADTRSTLTFGGDYGFATGVTWDDVNTLVEDKEGNATGWKTLPLVFTSGVTGEKASGTLMVNVDGATEIHEGGYTATLNLQAMVPGSLFPPGSMQKTVGRIKHDGTTVQLPYLTTDDRYNQRIIMVNRSAQAVAYSMSFDTEEGVMATAGTMASGMLAADSTTVLNVRAGDVVMLEGGPPHRTAATLVIAADPDDITVATNQTNRETGGTDTVKWH